MALIQFTYVSGLLERAVPVQVILPADKLNPQGAYLPPKKYKTLYLLNGYLGCHTDWVSGTRIQRWAEERDLAVVMPAGENSFYVDRPGFYADYGKFVGQELVEMTRRIFPLSERKEDTFIGGLSMGGYGAMPVPFDAFDYKNFTILVKEVDDNRIVGLIILEHHFTTEE